MLGRAIFSQGILSPADTPVEVVAAAVGAVAHTEPHDSRIGHCSEEGTLSIVDEVACLAPLAVGRVEHATARVVDAGLAQVADERIAQEKQHQADRDP